MDLGLGGKVAMVAAATKGIGLACAQELARAGCCVSICGRNSELFLPALERIEGEAKAFVCDVSNKDSLEAWFAKTLERFGQPDILVTNTGGPPAGNFSEMTDQQWQSGVDSTLMNVVRLVRLAAPGMIRGEWGRIIHLTSVVAKHPNQLLPISTTLRSGLMSLTRLQATEFAPFGITVNGVLPGHTLTDRQRHLAEIRASRDGISPEEALEKQAQEVPMKRLAAPHEIASAVTFLASQKASYITGVNLLVDGGITNSIG
ncbi:MAG: SDR family oxidoreductase [Fimbriimonadaceae bacterium]|jgi:3-oxoacyl-[acyl-carrier protein] reductase|nr:SDR family oxidoreductase [Fimbriimonadaceae bacterium]